MMYSFQLHSEEVSIEMDLQEKYCALQGSRDFSVIVFELTQIAAEKSTLTLPIAC